MDVTLYFHSGLVVQYLTLKCIHTKYQRVFGGRDTFEQGGSNLFRREIILFMHGKITFYVSIIDIEPSSTSLYICF